MSTAANLEIEQQNITSKKSHSVLAEPQTDQEKQEDGRNPSANGSSNCQSMEETAADTATTAVITSDNQGHCSDDSKTSATTSPGQSQLEAPAQESNNDDASSNNIAENDRESSMKNNKTDRRKSSVIPGIGIKYVETESLSSLLLYDSDSSSSFSSEEQSITTKQHKWKNDRQKSPSADSSSSSSSSESESDSDEDENEEDTTEDDDDEENDQIIEDLSDEEDEIPDITSPPKDSRNNKSASQNNKGAIRKNQGSSELEKEWGLANLPQVPDLSSLTINDGENFVHMGTIMGIIDQLVTVNSLPNMPAYDSETVLFLDEGRKPLGIIFDLLGQVSSPIYAVRFNSTEEIKQLGVEVGAKVYAAPTSNHTKYVFVRELLKQKGTDASWMDDDEIPLDFADFSDDEDEQQFRATTTTTTKKASSARKNVATLPSHHRGNNGNHNNHNNKQNNKSRNRTDKFQQAASAAVYGGEAIGTNIFGRGLIPTLAERMRDAVSAAAAQPAAGASAVAVNAEREVAEYRNILMRMGADSGLLFRDALDSYRLDSGGGGLYNGYNSFSGGGNTASHSRRLYYTGGGNNYGSSSSNSSPDNHKRFESTMNRRNLLNTKLNRYMDSYKSSSGRRQKYPASSGPGAPDIPGDAASGSSTSRSTDPIIISGNIMDNSGIHFGSSGSGNAAAVISHSQQQSSAPMFVQFDPTVPPPNLRPSSSAAVGDSSITGINPLTTPTPASASTMYSRTAWHATPPPPPPPAPSSGSTSSSSIAAYYNDSDWLLSLGGATGMELLGHPASHSRDYDFAVPTAGVLTNNTESQPDSAPAVGQGTLRPPQH